MFSLHDIRYTWSVLQIRNRVISQPSQDLAYMAGVTHITVSEWVSVWCWVYHLESSCPKTQVLSCWFVRKLLDFLEKIFYKLTIGGMRNETGLYPFLIVKRVSMHFSSHNFKVFQLLRSLFWHWYSPNGLVLCILDGKGWGLVLSFNWQLVPCIPNYSISSWQGYSRFIECSYGLYVY